MNKSKSISSKGGKHVSAMQRLAKLRSTERSKSPLQVGNVLTKKAPMGGKVPFGSKIDEPDGDEGCEVEASEGQTALNPKQKGASSKNAQKGKGKLF